MSEKTLSITLNSSKFDLAESIAKKEFNLSLSDWVKQTIYQNLINETPNPELQKLIDQVANGDSSDSKSFDSVESFMKELEK